MHQVLFFAILAIFWSQQFGFFIFVHYNKQNLLPFTPTVQVCSQELEIKFNRLNFIIYSLLYYIWFNDSLEILRG